jgi:hypothetical protein
MPKKEIETKTKIVKPAKKAHAKAMKTPAKKNAAARMRQKATPAKKRTKVVRPAAVTVKSKPTAKADDQYFAQWQQWDFIRTKEETYGYYLTLIISPLVIFWAYQAGSTMAVLAFLILMVIIIFELRSQPQVLEYKISIDGISIGDRLYKFADIESFSMAEKGGYHVAKIRLKDTILPIKEVIFQEGQDMCFMRALLAYFLPEREQTEMLFNFNGEKRLSGDELIDQKVREYLKGKL